MWDLVDSKLKLITAGLVSNLARVALYTYQAILIKEMVNQAVVGHLQGLMVSLVKLILLLVSIGLLGPAGYYRFTRLVKRAMWRLYQAVYDKLVCIQQAALDRYSEEEVYTLFTRDISQVEGLYDLASHMVFTVLYGLVALGLIMVLSIELGLFLLLINGVYLVLVTYMSRNLSRGNQVLVEIIEQLVGRVSELTSGLSVIKTLNIRSRMINDFTDKAKFSRETKDSLSKQEARLETLNSLFSTLNIIGVILIGVYMTGMRRVHLGDVAAITQLQAGVTGLFLNLSHMSVAIKKTRVSVDRLDGFLAETQENQGLVGLEPSAFDPSLAINLSRVSFAYEEDGKRVLDDVSFKVEQGRTFGLLGGNGQGKSTLIKLLTKTYSTYQGHISLFGQDLRNVSHEDLRARISYVPQSGFLFDMSIEDNLRLARPNLTKEDLISVCQQVGAHDFIMNLKGGYAFLLNDNGKNLSGGQRQKLNLARALLKEADIYILDEPVSEGDAWSRSQFLTNIRSICQKKTIILVSHDPVIRNSLDQVYQLEGHIKE